MEIKIFIIFILFLLQILILVILYHEYKIHINDIKYNVSSITSDLIKNNIEKNKRTIPINKKNSILIITYDNRADEAYVIEHNKNFTSYVNKHGYEYKFISKCNKNVYWCKIYLVYEMLQSNLYDYVMWIDSDAVILDMDFDLNNMINSYDCHLFLTDDNNAFGLINHINAGVFIIKNSDIGINYIKECLKHDVPNCINIKTNKLKGIWAGTCYEQGIMNIVLEKYTNNNNIFTIIPESIIYNGYNLSKINNKKILHYYGTTSEERMTLFSKINKDLGIV
jgi:hypothetical protein